MSTIIIVTIKGYARWQIIDENFSSDGLIEFLQILTPRMRGKSVLDPGYFERALQKTGEGLIGIN